MDIIELKLKEENKGEGITAISLVKHPAIEQNWVAFSEDGTEIAANKMYAFKTIDEEQRIVAGPAMIPDKLIYRMDDMDAESFVFFKAETIRELSERFIYQGKQNNMTLEHDATLNDLSVIESWIVEDPKRDKSAVYGFDLPVGTWFVLVKVLNDDVWTLVKENKVTGFSVEGVFARELIENNKDMKTEKLTEYLERIKTLFADETPQAKEEEAEEEKFGSVEATNADGAEAVINFPGDELAVGDAITYDVDGEQVPVPTGRWTLAGGGFLIVTEEGVVGSLEAEEAEEESTAAAEEKKEPEAKPESLTAAQMDKLIEGMAAALVSFKSDVIAHIDETVNNATGALREEFNKPAAKPKPETPETSEQKNVAVGLNKFVKDAENEKQK